MIDISYGTQPSPQKERQKKLLNVFEVVKFPNDPCTTSLDSTNTSGVCYTATECTDLVGFLGSSCASGFGVCCTFIGGEKLRK